MWRPRPVSRTQQLKQAVAAGAFAGFSRTCCSASESPPAIEYSCSSADRVAGSVSVFHGRYFHFLCRSDSVVAVDANNTMLAAGQIGQYLAMCGFPQFRRAVAGYRALIPSPASAFHPHRSCPAHIQEWHQYRARLPPISCNVSVSPPLSYNDVKSLGDSVFISGNGLSRRAFLPGVQCYC